MTTAVMRLIGKRVAKLHRRTMLAWAGIVNAEGHAEGHEEGPQETRRIARKKPEKRMISMWLPAVGPLLE
ncbi:MAG: hypothetical protein WC100_00490 [Sterolibacterium sp.]